MLVLPNISPKLPPIGNSTIKGTEYTRGATRTPERNLEDVPSVSGLSNVNPSPVSLCVSYRLI